VTADQLQALDSHLDLAPRDLAQTIEAALRDNPRPLVILDRRTNTWQTYSWDSIYQLGCRVAADLRRGTAKAARTPVGIVGEPTAELVGIIIGSWIAGRSIAVLPGSVRGASATGWAQATVARLSDIGCHIVYSAGTQLEQLQSCQSALTLRDTQSVAALRSATTAPVEVSAECAAIMQGTAGSTGVPKTAVQSRRAVLSHFRAVAERVGLQPEHDVLCSWLPLYHDMGLALLVLGMCSGVRFWLTGPAAFSRAPLNWIDWLSQSKATVLGAPNFAYDLVGRYAKRIEDADLSAVRVAFNGGEPVDVLAMERFGAEMERFGFDQRALTPAYGLAEATCGLTIPTPGLGLRCDRLHPAGESTPTRNTLLGRPLGGMEIRIVPGRVDMPATPQRAAGEVEFRGPTMMSGYLHDERVLGPQDWCPTGDIGYLHDGELVICGRLKEMMTFAGRNLFPQQIEEVAARIPGIDRGAVVAATVQPDAESPRQRTALVIVAEYRGDAEHGSVTDQICELVASECGVVPSRIELVARGSLPRTTSGKLRRLAVGSQYAAK
jgi:long-chain-fatty-acid--[acyl-carrier-protein] ligase